MPAHNTQRVNDISDVHVRSLRIDISATSFRCQMPTRQTVLLWVLAWQAIVVLGLFICEAILVTVIFLVFENVIQNCHQPMLISKKLEIVVGVI